jgi:hypothetical protein
MMSGVQKTEEMGMIRHRAIARLRALLPCLLFFSGVALGDPGITAVPPAANRAAINEKATTSPKMALPATAPALRIALPVATESETAIVRAKNIATPKSAKDAAKGAKGRPLAIGFGRPIPVASQTVALESLQWQALPDGSRAARIEIVSPNAAALRVALAMPATDPDLSVRFSGNALTAQVFGPIPANTIAEETARSGIYWSPTLDGTAATLEFQAGAGAKIDGIKLTIPRIAHHLLAGTALKQPDAKTVSDIGRSGACNIDVACVTPQTTAFVNATKAVAEILFTQEGGSSYLCTGTLINDSTSSNTPYFYTADHCIDSDMAARTMNTYWFFDAVACGATTVPAFVQQTAGAALLARSEDWDWALVRLNQAPPAGAFFSAWRAEAVPAAATVSVIHHPQGDLKKWAQGLSPGYVSYPDGSSYIQAQYSQGTTEGGSSGAGLLTFNSTGGYYEVRGGLFGGDASCSNLSGIDVYSRLDNLLPLARQYLTPGSNPSGTVVAVEFYNATLQHYFLSTNPSEINDLDTGVHVGWVRTGFRFLAYATQVGGANPVCRFYRAPAYGDSHFYSASPAECAATAAAHPVDWVYESPSVFYIQLPDSISGACPVGTLPIWRFFNQVTTNHRYTADQATRDDMRASPSIWIPEG